MMMSCSETINMIIILNNIIMQAPACAMLKALLHAFRHEVDRATVLEEQKLAKSTPLKFEFESSNSINVIKITNHHVQPQ